MERGNHMSDRNDEVLAYLAAHHVMTLATCGAAAPWASALFYANDGFNLTFLSSPQTRHAGDLALNPQAAAAIHENYRDWQDIKGIQLEGHVKRLTGADRIKAIARYADRHPAIRPGSAPALIQAALAGVAWYELITERCFFVDNSKGFGHRDEIDLS